MIPDECIDKLEQLILDENELVTYKLLSKELKIHVNEAKKYLYDFLKIQNSKEDVKLYAYYFISGIVEKDGVQSRKIILASEDTLKQIKEEFKEVTSCHIYSLNKGGCRDTSSIYNSQSWCKKLAEEHRKFSAIKHPNVLQQAPIIKKAEVKKYEAKPATTKLPTVKAKSEGVSLFKNQATSKNSLSSIDKKSTEAIKVSENIISKSDDATNSTSEPKDQKKSTLSSLWQKLEDKSKDGKNDNTKGDSKGKNKGGAKPVSKNNILTMFSKQAEKNATNPVKKATIESVSTPKQESVTAVKLANGVQSTDKNDIKSEKVNNQKKTKTSVKKVKRSKKVSDNESDEDIKPKKKKHKRICTMDDSDSESENEEEQDRAQRSLTIEENNDVASTPLSDDSEEPIPPTPPVLLNKGKKKVWKTVQKTYQDEEGFLVAKQEKVLVSASDSDEDPLPNKNSENKTNAKQNTFSYRKQASLTSFFKQK